MLRFAEEILQFEMQAKHSAVHNLQFILSCSTKQKMLQNIAAHQLQLASDGIFEVSAKSTQLSSCDNSLGGHCTEISELFLSAKVQGFTQVEV